MRSISKIDSRYQRNNLTHKSTISWHRHAWKKTKNKQNKEKTYRHNNTNLIKTHVFSFNVCMNRTSFLFKNESVFSSYLFLLTLSFSRRFKVFKVNLKYLFVDEWHTFIFQSICYTCLYYLNNIQYMIQNTKHIYHWKTIRNF